MTGSLIIIALLVLLVAALERTHRRASGSWHPGRDTRKDRDLDRLSEDLRSAEQREQLPLSTPPGLGYLTHRKMAEESRLLTRVAA